MRTAEQVFWDLSKIPFYEETERTDLIQEALDEAVAHGMTLAAEECFKLRLVYEAGDETIPAEHALYGETILTARDNKVWRRE